MALQETIRSNFIILRQLSKTDELVLYRAQQRQGDQPVLLKLPASARPPAAVAHQLRCEYATARELDPAFVVRPLRIDQDAESIALILEDFAGHTLADKLKHPLEDLAAFLRLAIGMTQALASIHRRGLVHKDIKPENVLLSGDCQEGTPRVKLTGFGIASKLSRERQSPAPPEAIAGTLAYMAPEQTGRMNRSVDSRSDLYALGVTFYKMLTGSLPFSSDDPMELVHCHVARQPLPPTDRARIPEPLSQIVLKLMAKSADERYQTATGLTADLRHCLAEWQSCKAIASFALGAQDTPDRLLIPEKLYGREREIETLLAIFERVVSSGSSELVLISGYSGIGKTSLVNELQKAIVPRRGLYATGKFEQLNHDIPFSTLVQALHALVRQILLQNETVVSRWREQIQKAVSPNGQLIVNLIPEIELITGGQPPLPDLPPQDAQNRFQRVLKRFLSVFATREHPLTLFLDDLQWLDSATLRLLGDLVVEKELRHLLLIGAYRDNEVSPSHPLMRTLDTIRESGSAMHSIVLAPLSQEDVGRLVADSLHCKREHSYPLAKLVYQKSGGNPFYVIQFFTALVDEQLLEFNPDIHGWTWDLVRIHAKGYTDNIVELIVGKLAKLPPSAQEAIEHCAYIGHAAPVATLCLVRGIREEELHLSLHEAVQAGLIVREEDSYSFVHDRVQEAAYSLIPHSERPSVHLHIGRLLASREGAELKHTIFEVVNQLNRATPLITSALEREHVAELNLLAGERAKASTAYVSAIHYLAVGEDLLPKGRWQARHYKLSFSLALRRAECEFLTSQYATAEQRLSVLAKEARNLVDLAAVTCLGVDLYMTMDRSDRAVEVCLEYLRHLGIEWSVHPTWEAVVLEYEQMWKKIGDRTVESLAELPLMTDPEWRGTIDVLTTVIPPAQVRDPNLLCLVVARAVNLSLEHGNSDGSCQVYVYLGMLLGQWFENYQAAFRFGLLARNLVDSHGLDRFKGRVYLSFGAFLNPWARHVSTGRALIHSALEPLTQSGDFTWAGYSGNNLITNLLASGEPLESIQREAELRLQGALKAHFGLVIDMVTGQLGLVRALRGMTLTPSSFSTADFNEDRFREHLEADPRLAFGNCSYWIRKQQAHFAAGEYESAIEAASKAERYLWTFPSFFETVEYHFYSGLAHAACSLSGAPEERKRHLEALVIHHKKFSGWSKYCPENFRDRAYLLAAEIARIEERPWDSQSCYEEAIRAARANGFVQNEALAFELASAFYRARRFEKIADAYLAEARACYMRWGAEGKVKLLEQQNPCLANRESQSKPIIANLPERLDLSAVAKAQRAISGQIIERQLAETLLQIVLENAGAQKGYLFVEPNSELFAVVSSRGPIQFFPAPSESFRGVATSLLNYVRRTGESVFLDDASSNAGDFSSDEYLLQAKPKSVLCMPILRNDKAIAVLYLENNLTTGAFTPERRSVLEMLASQAAISLETARVYEAMKESEAKYRRIVGTANEGIWMLGLDGRTTFVNARIAHMLGYAPEEIVGQPMIDFLQEEELPAHQKRMQHQGWGIAEQFECRFCRKDGQAVWAHVSAASIFDDEHHVQGVLAMLTDVSERKRAEEERLANLHFFESLARINQAMQGTNDLEQAMGNVLEAVLSIFGCDRAWLIHPCDPESASIRLVMEHTLPEYSGASALGLEVPTDLEVKDLLRMLLASSGPVTLGPGSELAVPTSIAAGFGVRSQIAMALFPKGDKPYVFGLHQCSYPRVWTSSETKLVQEVGQRMADCLTSLLAYRNLQKSERRLRRAEQALRTSEERFRELVQRAPEAILVFDHAHGRFTSANAHAELLFGRSLEELMRLGPQDLFDGPQPDGRPVAESLREHSVRALAGETVVVERNLRDARGRDMFLEARLTRMPFGNGKQIRASYIDITERKRIENAVRESERRLMLLIQAAPVGIVIHAADGRVRQSNHAAGRLLGVPEAEMGNRGLGHSAWKFIREDGTTMPLEEYPAAQVLARHEPLMNVVVGVRKPGAEGVGWMLVNAVPLLGPGGGALEVIVMFMDITERKRAEEQLKQDARRKDEFLAMLGHELRNPLAPIQNASHILKLVGSPDPRAQRAREMIERQVAHLSRLVDDLLDVARIARGKISLRRERLDWANLIRTTAGDFRSELEARGLALALQLPPRPVFVSGDPTRLAQVLSNILQNAMKFTGRGGRVAVELSPGGGGPATLAVQDTGIGMTRDTLDRIFSPFFQANVDLARSHGGMGLGLALVKGIVGLHGGTVDATSEGVGRGARISVRLPEIEAPPESKAPLPASPARSARSILVVEDNLDAARSLQVMLELVGHRVRVAADGPSGVVEARSFRPEIVVCDIGLPGPMDGYAVARALRADPALRTARLVALTGYGQEQDKSLAREAGFDVHLTKPANAALILNSL